MACIAHGQGVFVYDQQSSDELLPGEVAVAVQASQPLGQSFTPMLSSVGFIRLQLDDLNPGNGLGAMLQVNLRTGSITGPIVASSDIVSLPDGAPVSFVDFLFATLVSVTPNTTYYFQPVVLSGDIVMLGRFIPGSDYAGGVEYYQGAPGFDDLWFREGIVVPEPSSSLLLLLGGFVAWCRRRK
jgi:hypothetical protein